MLYNLNKELGKSKESSVALLYDTLEHDKAMQQELLDIFQLAFNSLTNLTGEVELLVPESLPDLAELFHCTIFLNGDTEAFKGRPLANLAVNTEKGAFLILKKKVSEVGNAEYVKEKTRLKLEICNLLLDDKKKQFTLLHSIGKLAKVQSADLEVSVQIIPKLQRSADALRKLKADNNKRQTSKLLQALQQITANPEEQPKKMKPAQAAEMINNAIERIEEEARIKQYQACANCAESSNPTEPLPCGHAYCRKCLMTTALDAKAKVVLPKCPVPSCFYIVTVRDIERGTQTMWTPLPTSSMAKVA
jgi:hypothetical protein